MCRNCIKEPLVFYMIKTMDDIDNAFEYDYDGNTIDFFHALVQSPKIQTVMHQVVERDPHSVPAEALQTPIAAWKVALIWRKPSIITTFINAELHMGDQDGALDIFRAFVYCNDVIMVRAMLQDESLKGTLNQTRYIILLKIVIVIYE